MTESKLTAATGALFTEPLGTCPICDANQWEYFGGRFHYDVRIEYWICPDCLLVGQSPQIPAAKLSEFYAHHYRQLYMGSSEPTAEEFEFQRKRGRNLLQIARDTAPDGSFQTILDFGCSAGGLLDVACREFSAKTLYGIELDILYGQHAEAIGVNLFTTAEDAISAGIGSIDLLTSAHVLEHVQDFTATLRDMHTLLKDDGLLALEVPHTAAGACFQLAHPWGFNENSLYRALKAQGFDVLAMTTHGYPREPENKQLYLVAIAQRSQQETHRFVPVSSSARRERKRRYHGARQNSQDVPSYTSVLIKTGIKQILGRTDKKLVNHSFFPTKLHDATAG